MPKPPPPGKTTTNTDRGVADVPAAPAAVDDRYP
jgi:hypothetical protein